jgi:hypothetical protein
MSVVFHYYDSLSLILRDEHRLLFFENGEKGGYVKGAEEK